MKKIQTKDGVFKLEFEDLNKRIDKYVLSGIPIDVLVDITNFESIYKSKKSNSFYNKDMYVEKSGSLKRISDHWNFKKEKKDERIFFKTDVNIKNKWAYAIYDKNTGLFRIVKIYSKGENEKEKLEELKSKLSKWASRGKFTIDDIRNRMEILKEKINSW